MTTIDTTTGAVTVSAEAPVAGLAAEIVATLPVTAVLAGPEAEVLIVAGAAGWSRRAGEAPAGVVIVVDPVHEPATDLEALASSGTVVVLGETYAGNPALAELDGLAGRLPAIFVNSLDRGSGTADQLLQQLRVLRAVGVRDVRVDGVAPHRAGLTWAGTAEGPDGRAVLRGVAATTTAGAPRIDIRALSPPTRRDRLFARRCHCCASARDRRRCRRLAPAADRLRDRPPRRARRAATAVRSGGIPAELESLIADAAAVTAALSA